MNTKFLSEQLANLQSDVCELLRCLSEVSHSPELIEFSGELLSTLKLDLQDHRRRYNLAYRGAQQSQRAASRVNSASREHAERELPHPEDGDFDLTRDERDGIME